MSGTHERDQTAAPVEEDPEIVEAHRRAKAELDAAQAATEKQREHNAKLRREVDEEAETAFATAALDPPLPAGFIFLIAGMGGFFLHALWTYVPW